MLSFMLNSNLLRTCRWEWTRTELSRKLHQDRLRGLIAIDSLLLVITLSLSTIKPSKKQIAFIISQICLVICVYILITNIPPILLEIFNATDIFELGSGIVIFIVYSVVLGFLFLILILSWVSLYFNRKEREEEIQQVCIYQMTKYDPTIPLCIHCEQECPFDQDHEPKKATDTYYIIPLDESDLTRGENDGK